MLASERVDRREDADLETASDGYARRFSGEVGRWFLEMQTRTVLELLHGLPPLATILDIGGGHAQVTPVLVNAGFRVTVVGSHPLSGVRIVELLDSDQCRFEVADLQRLPHADASVDAVVCLRLLPHSVDWTRLVRELCRVARRSVLVDYPSTRSLNVVSSQLFGLKRRIEGNTRPFTLFQPSRVRAVFQQQGFHLGAERPQFLFPMVLHRWTDSVVLSRLVETGGRSLGLTRWLGSPILARADRPQE